VRNTKNVALVRSIGADEVIDYTREDFTRGGQRYDLILYIGGNRSISDCRHVLTPDGVLVVIGGAAGAVLGPVRTLLSAAVRRRFGDRQMRPLMAKRSNDDLIALTELIAAGKVRPVVDRTYPLSETAAAMRYLEDGHPGGKVVVTI
jgi:NADPH:quinone reductase-like Zn-dependent oxidoreductase